MRMLTCSWSAHLTFFSFALLPLIQHTLCGSPYSLLDHSGKTFRLLDLHPGRFWNDIHLTLRIVSLVEQPGRPKHPGIYEALSYAWGPESTKKSVVLNGERIYVRDSLYAALQGLRDTKRDRTLWIDALCINQDDVNERNHQVSMMATIYHRSSSVLTWIEPTLRPNNQQLGRMQNNVRGRPTVYKEDEIDIEPYLWHFIHREYWRRAWIVQELGSASEIYVHFGKKKHHRIRWEGFIEMLEAYKSRFPLDTRVQEVLRFDEMRKARLQSGRGYSLVNLLSSFSNSFSTDSRDKLYAFLGLADDVVDTNCSLPADYSHTIPEVYWSTMRYFAIAASDVETKEIQAVYLSALVRRLLARESGSKTTKERSFNYIIPETGWAGSHAHREMRKAPNGHPNPDEAGGYIYLAMGIDLLIFLFNTVWEFLSATVFPMEVKYWRNSQSENVKYWLPDTPEMQQININIRGSTAGEISFIGDQYNNVTDNGPWDKQLLKYTSSFGAGTLRAQNKRLMKILYNLTDVEDFSALSSLRAQADHHTDNGNANMTWANFSPWPGPRLVSASCTAGGGGDVFTPRLFVGSNGILGIVPPAAEIGDLIVQFWRSSTAAVVRRGQDGGLQLIGRCGMVQKGNSTTSWDVPIDEAAFAVGKVESVRLAVDMEGLTRLSLNTVRLEDGMMP